jgi:hypothetical protein
MRSLSSCLSRSDSVTQEIEQEPWLIATSKAVEAHQRGAECQREHGAVSPAVSSLA